MAVTPLLDQHATVKNVNSPIVIDVRFVRPVIGFADSVRYELRTLDPEYAPYRKLVSIDEPGLEFIVIAPGLLYTDYIIEIGDADTEALELESVDDVEVLVLVTAGKAPVPTVNLLGPIVINRSTGAATQLVLQDDQYTVAVPVNASSARS